MRSFPKLMFAAVLLSGSAITSAQDLPGGSTKLSTDPTKFADEFKQQAEKECKEYELLKTACDDLVEAFASTIDDTVSGKDFFEAFKDSLKSKVLTDENKVEWLNANLVKERLDDLPLDVEFKLLDTDNNDTVIGMEFSYSKKLDRSYLSREGDMQRYYGWDINVRGTVTQEAEENPRNFIEAKASFLGGRYTKIPIQPEEIQDIAVSFTSVECVSDPQCIQKSKDFVFNRLATLGGATYLKYGLEAGYEADQEFDAKNATLTGFFAASYESWDTESFLGSLAIRPTIRLAVDEVNPSAETPRALAGDESSYSRFSGEFSVRMPVNVFMDQRVTLGFNYRTYQELSASDIVKNAGFDRYHLRTWSLSLPGSVLVTYSSGSLPFDLQSEEVVALGWQTYF